MYEASAVVHVRLVYLNHRRLSSASKLKLSTVRWALIQTGMKWQVIVLKKQNTPHPTKCLNSLKKKKISRRASIAPVAGGRALRLKRRFLSETILTMPDTVSCRWLDTGVAFEMAESSVAEGRYSHPLHLLVIGSWPGQRRHHRAQRRQPRQCLSEDGTEILCAWVTFQ